MGIRQPEKSTNHGCTQMDTDQKQISIETFRLTQGCAVVPLLDRLIFQSASVFMRFHPWLQRIVPARQRGESIIDR
jgi:hypothetical protein